VRVTHDNENNPSFLFFVQLENSLFEYREVQLNSQSRTRLFNDLNDQTEAIIECTYDNIKEGEWIYYKIATKPCPTPFIKIIQQLEVVGENISIDEIKVIQKTLYTNTPRSPKKTYQTHPKHDTTKTISPKEEIVYESPIKTEEKTNSLKRKLSEIDDGSPDLSPLITFKKPRLSEDLQSFL